MPAGTLFLVATPIGNLEDVTLRALRVLREADLIAAEDTRRTAKLLTHYQISTPTLSFHAYNTRSRLPQLIRRLKGGATLALVSDAGTPGISDPGVELVRKCIEQQIAVEPVPGPSAPLAAAIASGFSLSPLTILGFVPVRSKDRTEFFRLVSSLHGTVVFFEAPHRIRKLITSFDNFKFVNRPICVARELTKLHSEIMYGSADEIAPRLEHPRGEYTVVIGPKNVSLPEADSGESLAKAVDEFGHMREISGVSRRSTISKIAKKHGVPTKLVYAEIERRKKSAI